ncbi:unnamed protein product, partial [Callosobruchus maculatus]
MSISISGLLLVLTLNFQVAAHNFSYAEVLILFKIL